MRGLVFDGPYEIRFAHDLPEPEIKAPTDAVVAVSAAGLCGSDLHAYQGRETSATGVVPGHEAVGIVLEVGADVTRVEVGERVIVPFTASCGHCERCGQGLTSRCWSSELFGWGDPSGRRPPLPGTQAERLRVPLADGTLVQAPTDVDDATALLLSDNFPTAWDGVARTDWRDGPLAVIGLGSVGLCAVAAALAHGVTEVMAIDPVEERRVAAVSLGVGVTARPPGAAGDLGRFPAVVEAAGPVAAQELAASIADIGATISILSVQTAEHFGIDPVTAYERNLTIRAGRAPVRRTLDDILPRVSDGLIRVPTATVITHPDQALEDGPDLYRTFAAREEGLIKATFRPGD